MLTRSFMFSFPPVLRKFPRFSAPEVRGELPRSGALVMDHSVCRGVIFIDNGQAIPHDKGEVIAEYVSLLLQSARSSGSLPASRPSLGVGMTNIEENRATSAAAGIMEEAGVHTKGAGGVAKDREQICGVYAVGSELATMVANRKRKCVLVDNTSRKCEKAATSFAKVGSESLELHIVHFTEAEGQVDSPEALVQLSRILSRLRAQGLITEDLQMEHEGVAGTGTGATAQGPSRADETAGHLDRNDSSGVAPLLDTKPEHKVLRSSRNRMGSSEETCGILRSRNDARGSRAFGT